MHTFIYIYVHTYIIYIYTYIYMYIHIYIWVSQLALLGCTSQLVELPMIQQQRYGEFSIV